MRSPTLLLLLAASSCDDRFEFDVPVAGAGGSVAGSSGRPSTDGGAGRSGGASGSPACGASPPCPASLSCVAGECVECTSDGDCSSELAPHCALELHRCVTCVEDTDCAPGSKCDELANHCLPICGEGVSCPLTAHGCDEQRGVCYQCDEDRECRSSPRGPLCATDGSGCVSCRTDSDCGSQHCDPLGGVCVDCRDGADCSSARCEPVLHTCLP